MMDRNLPSTQPQPAPSEPPVPESTVQPPSGKVGIGDTGVFAGDWTPYERNGAWHFPVGFVGTLVDWWNGWAVFTCTRQVAEAIVSQQEDLRDAERLRLRDSGLSGDELSENVDEMIPPMYWDADEIVLDESMQYGSDEGITESLRIRMVATSSTAGGGRGRWSIPPTATLSWEPTSLLADALRQPGSTCVTGRNVGQPDV